MDNVFDGGGRIEKDYTDVYTPWRRFLAWVGLLLIMALAIGVLGGVIWANGFINAGISL